MLTNLEWDKVNNLIDQRVKELEERLIRIESESNKPSTPVKRNNKKVVENTSI